MAECQFVKLKVAGSNPVSYPKEKFDHSMKTKSKHMSKETMPVRDLEKAINGLVSPWKKQGGTPPRLIIKEIARKTQASDQRVINTLLREKIILGEDKSSTFQAVIVNREGQPILPDKLTETALTFSPYKRAVNQAEYRSRAPGGGPVVKRRINENSLQKAMVRLGKGNLPVALVQNDESENPPTVKKRGITKRYEPPCETEIQARDLIRSATNTKLREKCPTDQEKRIVDERIRGLLLKDWETIKKITPIKDQFAVFKFFYYLRTNSVAEPSGINRMGTYFAEACVAGTPITILSWDCPGSNEPLIINGEITRYPQTETERIVETVNRRRFVQRIELGKQLLETVDTVKTALPVEFVIITAGNNSFTVYPNSTRTCTEVIAAENGAREFNQRYDEKLRESGINVPVFCDLDVYEGLRDPNSLFWQIYRQVMDGIIPIPPYILQKQLEIIARITDPLGLTGTKEAERLAKRVIAAYGAEGVILDYLKPVFGNIIIAATEAISVYYQRTNFCRKYFGIPEIPTFYTLYD